MQPATVGAILDAIAKHWTIAPTPSHARSQSRPASRPTRFRGYRTAGVNRVSLGVQALDDASLKELGRLHSAQEALDAVAIARSVVRALFLRPDLRAAAARRRRLGAELKRAIAEAAEHLSLYQSDHRAGHAVRALHPPASSRSPTRTRRATLRHDAGDLRAAGLPAYEIPITRGPAPNAGTISSIGAAQNMPAIGPGAHGRLDIDGERAPPRPRSGPRPG
jgi:oxygen-independent coproporphyrinogen-3 oxidase